MKNLKIAIKEHKMTRKTVCITFSNSKFEASYGILKFSTVKTQKYLKITLNFHLTSKLSCLEQKMGSKNKSILIDYLFMTYRRYPELTSKIYFFLSMHSSSSEIHTHIPFDGYLLGKKVRTTLQKNET